MSRTIETEKRCKCGRHYKASKHPGEVIPAVCANCDPAGWKTIADARAKAKADARKARAEANA